MEDSRKLELGLSYGNTQDLIKSHSTVALLHVHVNITGPEVADYKIIQ